jgi:membrane-associated protease RseP (regulator of RpoE activity)
VVIVQVQPNSPAAAVGLRAGDVITSVNGNSVGTDREVTVALANAPVGQQVALGILRGSSEMTVTVTLGTVQAVPGFENLPAVLQERLRELAQSGNFTLEQLQRLAMGQNNIAMGTVKSISDASLTLTRIDNSLQATGDVTFALNERTQYRRGADTLSLKDIQTGNTVFVISLDGQTAIGVFVLQR